MLEYKEKKMSLSAERTFFIENRYLAATTPAPNAKIAETQARDWSHFNTVTHATAKIYDNVSPAK